MTDQFFHSLNLVELQIFLEHIRLGPDHVRKLLNQQQFTEVLALGHLTPEQQRDVKSNALEKTGNVALVLNTIITSTFGAWMGLSSCIGLDLGSTFIFSSVILLACVLSTAIGYNSYHVIKEQTTAALRHQKFANLELKILQMITLELQKKSYKLGCKLYRAIKVAPVDENQLPIKGLLTDEETQEWFEQFENFMRQRLQEFSKIRLYEAIKKRWEIDFRRITKILKTHASVIHQLSEPLTSDQGVRKHKHKDCKGMELLIDPDFAVPKISVVTSSRLKKNSRILLVSLAPTLLGGFASMFVFIGGIPNIVQAFGFEQLHAFLTHFYARLVEIGLAFSITCYFGFAHVYSAGKAGRREGHLTASKQAITNQETAMLAKNSHVKMLYKIKHIVSCMFSPYPIYLLENRFIKRKPSKGH